MGGDFLSLQLLNIVKILHLQGILFVEDLESSCKNALGFFWTFLFIAVLNEYLFSILYYGKDSCELPALTTYSDLSVTHQMGKNFDELLGWK